MVTMPCSISQNPSSDDRVSFTLRVVRIIMVYLELTWKVLADATMSNIFLIYTAVEFANAPPGMPLCNITAWTAMFRYPLKGWAITAVVTTNS
jgi:hypothetical protein